MFHAPSFPFFVNGENISISLWLVIVYYPGKRRLEYSVLQFIDQVLITGFLGAL
jgi:hypothetical protein